MPNKSGLSEGNCICLCPLQPSQGTCAQYQPNCDSEANAEQMLLTAWTLNWTFESKGLCQAKLSGRFWVLALCLYHFSTKY